MTQTFIDSNGRPVPVFKQGVTQNVAYTGVSGAITNPVAEGVRLVRVWCTTDAFVTFGASPTATSSHMPITAKVAEYLPVKESDKVAAIQVTAGGTMYVTELH